MPANFKGLKFIYTHLYIPISPCISIHTRACTHTYTRTHVHAHIHAHTHVSGSVETGLKNNTDRIPATLRQRAWGEQTPAGGRQAGRTTGKVHSLLCTLLHGSLYLPNRGSCSSLHSIT